MIHCQDGSISQYLACEVSHQISQRITQPWQDESFMPGYIFDATSSQPSPKMHWNTWPGTTGPRSSWQNRKKSKTGQQIVSRAKKKPTQKITRNNVAKTSSSWLSPAKISATTWVLVPKRTKLRDHNTGFLQKQIYGTNYASRTVWSMRFVLWIYNQVQDMFQFSYLTHRISEMSSDRRWRCWWAVGNLALSLHRTWPPECLFPWIQFFFKVVVWCSDTLLFQGYQP